MPDFKLPDLGEGVAEAEVDRWLVKEGDDIAEDEPLVEVITDKATVEIPSPFAGAVARIHVEAGRVVPVGTVLVTIGDEKVAEAPGAEAGRSPVAPPEVAAEAPGELVKATPPVRKLARSLGVDLASVTGSGPGGRVVRADVEGAAGLAPPAPVTELPGTAPTGTAPPQRGSVGRRQPLRGIRRKVAERMAEAHRTIPSVTHVEECDVTELDATRGAARERDPEGPRVTFLPFIVKAVTRALRAHPALNASLDEDAEEIVFHDRCHIGIAVDTPNGLVVPVIRDAGEKPLRALAAEVGDLATRARAGSLSAAELQGGTFTVTSPGPFGGLLATPIILHPQSGILGVHRATERPVVRDGHIVVRKMMNLSISFDHRILDGMTAARFAVDVARLLEHPALLLLDD
ncbi:MAG: dihydrolipoamide acetyltransferase family protein [Actinomycetota bacterium]